MSELIDPETIGEKRPARQVRTGWHVDGGLALHDAIVGKEYVVVNVRLSNGETEPRTFRRDEYAWTRTPGEQLQYIEASHRQLVAQASLEGAALSSRPVPPCRRAECAATRRELSRLRAQPPAASMTAPVVAGVWQ